MAIRTGIQHVDNVITSFAALHPELRHGDNSRNRCGFISGEFQRFAMTRCVELVSIDMETYCFYPERPIRGCGMHMLNILVFIPYQFSIDFTASQYGFTEYPMVMRRLHPDGPWETHW